ncbi:MAG: hypothetical protein E6389_14035 [Clostridium perfringens]|uniref:hypothetical protein n=1 Tax=Clostridium perfringens TaxID=1502 RepID=UPI001FAC20CE|nr:hypothetical protein [Clostridium perfringens]MDU6896493.1 hypothetical protein [Clostridium perfringens]MDU6933635.1 hypothetical protein [Clostridium perfringens]
MFCSVKKGKDKYGETYKFYLCERYRDKETGKVKSSDKYIMTLQGDKILNDINIAEIKEYCINKNLNNNDIELIVNKINVLKNVVSKDRNTTTKKNVVIENNNTTDEEVEIVQADIIEECDIDYKTLIMFDVQREYSKNIKDSLKMNSLINAFGGNKKDIFEIEEEELKKIHDKADTINKKIEEILEEHYKIEKLNNKLIELNSNIRVIHDIYISCYDKVPSSEIWVIGGSYITRIYEISDLILPHMGYSLYDEWEEIKTYDNLDDSKAYIHDYESFEELNLYDTSNIQIDKKDITGSLIKIMLSGNCTIEYSCSDFIDINFNGNSMSLSIEHLVDWINNKPTRDYKVYIDDLINYKEQLYKYKNVF